LEREGGSEVQGGWSPKAKRGLGKQTGFAGGKARKKQSEIRPALSKMADARGETDKFAVCGREAIQGIALL